MIPLINFLVRSFQKQWSPSHKMKNSQVEVCPNCWGRQEWCDQYIPVSLTWSKDKWDYSKFRNGFILNFVKKYL